jgi:HEPN domain-containing protein
MKAITREWLARAADDLATARVLLAHEDLTNMVAFHAQQAVEKTLKAAIEELQLKLVRTHSLTRLYELIRPRGPQIEDLDMLDRLEAVYIATRYPSEMGLLPYGKPTLEEARALYHFAQEVFEQIQAWLETSATSGAGSSFVNTNS